MPELMGDKNGEHTLKLYRYKQDAIDITVDFDDPNLMAAATTSNSTGGTTYPPRMTVIFDQGLFNQDIFITHSDNAGSENCNYYIELEQVKLDVNEAAVATLKDMRGTG